VAGILHAATFCWVGGDSGAWRNSASWTDENGNTVSSFPGRYDTAVFSSINSVTITDAITASDVGDIQAENTDLTFKENVYFRGTTVIANSLTMEKEAQFLGALESITTTGEQVYAGNCVTNRDVVLTGAKVSFEGPINSWSADSRKIEIVGDASFKGIIGGTQKLSSLKVSGALTLAGNVSITADSVSFGSTVDSDSDTTARSLAITGNAEFSGAVGGTNLLSSLSVTGTTMTSTDVSFNAGSGTLTFRGAFSGSATINSPAVFSAGNTFTNLTVGSGTQTFDITITFAGGTTQTVSGTLSCNGTSANYVTLTSG